METVVDSIIKMIPSLVTWGLVVIGWLVVNDQTQYRDISKNYYAELDGLRDKLSEIEKNAVTHHMGQFEGKNVRQILRDISNLGMEVSQLAKRKCIGYGASEYVVQLRKAITSKNFDESSFQAQDLNSAIMLGIEVAKDSFDRLLLESIDMVSNRRRPLIESIKAAFNKSSWRG